MQPDVSERGERHFCDIGEDIKLSHISLKAGQSVQILPSNNAAVWLQYCGELKIDAQPHFSRAGHTFYQRANQFATLFAVSDVTLYKVSSNLPDTN
jgi:hypothetical protein